MRVLAVGGSDAKEFASTYYEEASVDIIGLKARNMHKDYDAVLSYMCLPNAPISMIDKVVKSWVGALKDGGELVVFVPSLEWAARQILLPNPSPALFYHLYGDGKDNFYHSGYTLMDMRSILSKAGVAVTHAQTGTYMIDSYECDAHILRGEK